MTLHRVHNLFVYDDKANYLGLIDADFETDNLTISRLAVLRDKEGYYVHVMPSSDLTSQVWSLNRDGEDVHFVTVPNTVEGSNEALAKLVAKGWEHLHPDQPHPLPSSQEAPASDTVLTTPFTPFDTEGQTNEDDHSFDYFEDTRYLDKH